MKLLAMVLVGLVAVACVPAVSAAPLLASPHAGACYLDVDASGTHGIDEPVYLLAGACSAGPAGGDIRYNAFGGRPSLAILQGDDPDVGKGLVPIAAAYAFFDMDGDGVYSLQDRVYLAFGPVPGQLRPGDLPLWNGTPRALQAGDPETGLPVALAPVAVGGESYAETDGHGGFSTGDVVYLDMDGSGQSSLGDIRLALPRAAVASSAPPTTSPASTTPPTSVSLPALTSPVTSPSQAVPPPTPSASENPFSSSPSRGIPVITVGASIAGLFAIASVRRR